jgi:hypothetical protein
MSAPLLQPEDALLMNAASLAFAVIRFAEGAAHPRRGTPADLPRVGEDVYVFGPSSRRVPRDDVPRFLARLPAPVILYPTTVRGIIALQLLSELSGDRAAGARKELGNQRVGLDEMADQLGLTTDSRILLTFGDEVHIVSFAVLQLYIERFLVQVGWSLGSLQGDPRASARLHLFRSDGVGHKPFVNFAMSAEELDQQFERTGVDRSLRSGFGMTGTELTAEDVALALRTTPDGAGTPGLEKRLHEILAARRAKDRGR